jgi:hypothetical protein
VPWKTLRRQGGVNREPKWDTVPARSNTTRQNGYTRLFENPTAHRQGLIANGAKVDPWVQVYRCPGQGRLDDAPAQGSPPTGFSLKLGPTIRPPERPTVRRQGSDSNSARPSDRQTARRQGLVSNSVQSSDRPTDRPSADKVQSRPANVYTM